MRKPLSRLAICLLVTALLVPGVIGGPAQAASMPDLVVLDAWLSGNQVWYTLKNAGTAPIGGAAGQMTFYCGLSIGGKQVAEDYVTIPLAAGQQVNRAFAYTWQPQPGQYLVSVWADSGQDIAESNEQNNLWQEQITVTAPQPDLVILDVYPSGTQIWYTLKNAGNGALGSVASPVSYYSSLRLGQTLLAEDHVTIPLAAGQQVERAFPYIWQQPPGQYIVTATADSRQDVVESNEQNNVWQGPVTVSAALPDLVVSDLAVGAGGKLLVTVANTGPGALPSGWQAIARVYFGGVDQGFFSLQNPTSSTGGGIASPGGTSSYLIAWEITGLVRVRAVADAGLSIVESNEQNNSLERDLSGLDTDPPKITSGPGATQISRSSAVIVWSTDEPSSSVVKYGKTPGDYGYPQGSSAMVTAHSINLSGLAAATTYFAYVGSEDASGNSVTSRTFTFTTLAASDSTKPTLTFSLPPVLSGLPLVTAGASDNTGVDRVLFFMDGSLAYTDYSAPFEWPLDTTGLPDGSHTIKVQAFDAAGNVQETIRTGTVRNRFPIGETPVTVTILNPEPHAGVNGIVEIRARIEATTKSYITHAEVEINDSRVYQVDFPIPTSVSLWSMGREADKPVYLTYLWDTRTLGEGSEIVVEVTGRDQSGNEGQKGIRVTKAAEPQPSFEVTRSVVRHGNYFTVQLTVRNAGTSPSQNASELLTRDICRGFAASADRPPVYDHTRSEFAVEKYVPSLAAGASVTWSYDAVPVLFEPMIDDYLIGTRTEFQYRDGVGTSRTQEVSIPYVPGDAVSAPYPLLPRQVGDALATADYLLVTDGERLTSAFAADDANVVIQTMATLAKLKNGVLGMRRPGVTWASAEHIKDNLPGDALWGSRLPIEFCLHGYLLLVGETDIVPAFNVRGFAAPFTGGRVDTVPITDFPYSNVWGDELPELRVGRIIGETARELMTTMESSIAVHLGRLVYDRSNALLVSGPEGTWEVFVTEAGEIGSILRGQGVATTFVHGEYYHERVSFLREALVISGEYRCLDEPGHLRSGGSPCPLTHPPLDLATLRTLITEAEATTIQDNRRGFSGMSYTLFATACEAGDRRGELLKSGARDKDVIFWGGHGGPGGWGWVLDDFIGGCGAMSDLYVDRTGNPLSFGGTRPVVWAASCLTGNYEAEPGRSGARAFLRHGAAAYIGATEVSPCGPQQDFNIAFFQDYWDSATVPIGDALTMLKAYGMIRTPGDLGYGYDWWRYMSYEYNLYGDPKFVGR